jgi:hypothetical protein
LELGAIKMVKFTIIKVALREISTIYNYTVIEIPIWEVYFKLLRELSVECGSELTQV